MVMDLNNMTQQEFDELLAEVKEESPNLSQFIKDFIDKKVTREEASVYLSMTSDQQQNYIDNYQAR
ncbi:hypothetical protein [Streptococcus suis]|uniref:hypothetical protein n=1 Tax=Streptococcus suis TaxID=1307 RepID=UPI00041B3A26|nr:hypothetical protein [Streptococcus suis]MCB2862117.1 hypothetical protein [Streptococcus suis]MCB2888810.1 hypothetical protein [Streptococcus suis]